MDNFLFSGLKVLDVATVIAAPAAAMMLADFGADVIKIEAPKGDPMRQIGPPPANGMGAMFLGMSRNKRGVVLDLFAPCFQTIMRAFLL